METQFTVRLSHNDRNLEYIIKAVRDNKDDSYLHIYKDDSFLFSLMPNSKLIFNGSRENKKKITRMTIMPTLFPENYIEEWDDIILFAKLERAIIETYYR